jgi:hypothetical protein
LLTGLREAPLLAGELPEAPVFDRRCLTDSEAGALLRFDQKLGHLCEDALRQLLDASPKLRLLAAGLQVTDGDNTTLGELDFLLGGPSGSDGIHLELAVKFFLAHFDGTVWHFPGPDPRDCWQRKLNRLRSHQLQLTRNPRVRTLLRERFGIDHVSVRQLLYGRLFLPMDGGQVPLPDAMSADGLRGRWIHRSQWAHHFGAVQAARIIPKALWPVAITPAVFDSLKPLHTHALLERARNRCTLIALEPGNAPVFVVPDTWPQP